MPLSCINTHYIFMTKNYLRVPIKTLCSKFTNLLFCSRNPNFPRNPTSVNGYKPEKQRSGATFDWDPYDPTYKKYLHIGKWENIWRKLFISDKNQSLRLDDIQFLDHLYIG